MPHLTKFGEIHVAIKLSRMAIRTTQFNDEIRGQLRAVYENDADALIASLVVVAINFQKLPQQTAFGGN